LLTICESPLEVIGFFSFRLFHIPVIVSRIIAKAIKTRIPEIGRKKENTIADIWRAFSLSLVSNIVNCVFIVLVVLKRYRLEELR
jgi:hypothetical protein